MSRQPRRWGLLVLCHTPVYFFNHIHHLQCCIFLPPSPEHTVQACPHQGPCLQPSLPDFLWSVFNLTSSTHPPPPSRYPTPIALCYAAQSKTYMGSPYQSPVPSPYRNYHIQCLISPYFPVRSWGSQGGSPPCWLSLYLPGGTSGSNTSPTCWSVTHLHPLRGPMNIHNYNTENMTLLVFWIFIIVIINSFRYFFSSEGGKMRRCEHLAQDTFRNSN